ncbi:nuclear transport factor 2 family protein [Hoeflea prorocentri]|uniref:DUF4440 domain-containing protein n=1 Tax=Hoeflea prorocentri TaxID=1922333 RepID=A0A9X3UK72_9HYPH|nr:nuclear transport factor 2 family protein [Hoeflea prorocentri]MCY6382091.1 DUF4440 domain-containing protein [Hoeflea prorocentri]MDA5399891.1 DUF4440 domain-containing protein [Hoeflea prorocentri]
MKDLEEDRAAILAVVDAETEAYLQRDYDAWEKCWHDGPEIRRIHSHVGTGVTVVAGPEIRTQMHRLLSENIEWQVPEAIRRENMNIVVSAEMAWVSYDQIGDMSSIPKEMAGHYHELKILHKIDGSWKIACIVGTQMRIDHVRAPLVEVDETARLLWMNEAAQDRLPNHPMLGLRANRLHAAEPDAQGELLSAVDWIAKVRDRHTPCVGEDAVTRAIALGQDDTGLAHICWAILRDGRLLITFDDTDRLERQLASAAAVYGLSQAQEKLARHLVEGRDLGAAAAALGISPNTAKTHLQRIYDKTGVRAQPALVRLLLNADRRGI